MSLSAACPCCDALAWKPFISFQAVPRTGLFPDLPPAVVPRQDLDFEYCSSCGLIRRRRGELPDPDYTEVARSTAAQLPAYLDEVEEAFAALCPDRERLVVDIGGNDGSFLLRLRRKGYANTLNVEPSRLLARQSEEAGCPALRAPFDSETAAAIAAGRGRAGAIFLRHVLEHVADPLAMLRAVHNLLAEDGVLHLELPDSRGIVEYGLAHELWEEHLYCHSLSTVSLLLRKAGFTVLGQAVHPHRGGFNLLFQARKSKPGEGGERVAAPVPAGLASFRARWSRRCLALHRAALTWPRPVRLLGASHPQTNFLHYSGLNHLVSCAIDDDANKIGRFLNMTPPVPVLSTAQFAETATGGTLLLTAWGCTAWTERVREAALAAGVRVVDPQEVCGEA